jgi:hypothetical protein
VERLDLSTDFPSITRFRQHSGTNSGDESINSDENSIRTLDSSTASNQNQSKGYAKDRPILFKPKSFLAVRNEEGTFFLCQACQTVYEDSKKCKIQWMEDLGDNKYKFGQVDWVDPLAIICKVRATDIL